MPQMSDETLNHIRYGTLMQVQSTPEQIAQGELDYLKDFIQEHNIASKVNPTTLDVVMFRIEQGLLTANEAIQQLSHSNACTLGIRTPQMAYSDELRTLAMRCKVGHYNNVSLSEQIELLSCKFGKLTFEVIADLFSTTI